MKIKLGTRYERMEDKKKSVLDSHRWHAWFPVIVTVVDLNQSGYVEKRRKELYWLEDVERCYNDYHCVWFFPKLWIFTYNYKSIDDKNPPKDLVPDQLGYYKRIEINKILRNHRYEIKLRKKIPAVMNAWEHYQTIAGLSFDDKLKKED